MLDPLPLSTRTLRHALHSHAMKPEFDKIGVGMVSLLHENIPEEVRICSSSPGYDGHEHGHAKQLRLIMLAAMRHP